TCTADNSLCIATAPRAVQKLDDLSIDGVQRFSRSVVCRRRKLRPFDLVKALLSEASVRYRGGLHHMVFHHLLSEHRLHEADHLLLRNVRGLVAGDQISEPIKGNV